MKHKKHRFISGLLAVVFMINLIDPGLLKETFNTLRAYAAATDYSVGFLWDISELTQIPDEGSSSVSGDTTTIFDSANSELRDVTLDASKTTLLLKEYKDENPVLKTTFSFNLKKSIDPGNMEFTITGLDELIRNGTLTLNMNDPNLVKTWKIEKVPGEDKYKFTNLVRVTSNNQTTFTWQFNSRSAVNDSNITLETSCKVKEIETDPDTGEIISTTTIPLDTNPITFKYQSVADENEVKIVCEDIDKLDVNNLNKDYDWRSYRSMLGLKGISEYATEQDQNNQTNPTDDIYDAHYVGQSKATQEGSLKSRGIKTSDYFIEVDTGGFDKNDILIVNANGDRVTLETVEIDGHTYYGFYDFIGRGNYKPGISYNTVYRVGVLNTKVADDGLSNKEIKLTGHYVVTYDDETAIHDFTNSAAHTLHTDDTQGVSGGSQFYKHNTYEVNRAGTASNGIWYEEHARPASPVNRLLYDSIFNDKVVTYYLYADTNQAKVGEGDSAIVAEYDLVYEDTAPTIEHLNSSYTDSDGNSYDLGYTARSLFSAEYDFTRVKVKKLIDGNTVGIVDHTEPDGTIVYKDPIGFNYDVYGRSKGGQWTLCGSDNTAKDSEVFLPDGIDEIRLVVRKLTIRANITAEVDVRYNIDGSLYPYINIDNANIKTADNKVFIDTNTSTRLKNTFTRTQYVGTYENPTSTNYGDSTYSLSWLRESTTTIDSYTEIEDFKYHDAWSELSEEEKTEAGSFRPSDYYTTNITSKSTFQSDTEKALNHFVVVSELPAGVTPSEGWLNQLKDNFEFFGVIQGTNEPIDAKYVLDHDAVSIYYDSEKGLIVTEFNFDGYSLKGDELTTVKYTYPASITLGKVKAMGMTQSQFVTNTYATVLDKDVKLSSLNGKSLIEAIENPFSDTQASMWTDDTSITALGSQKNNYSEKQVASYYNEWSFDNTAEVDGNNTDFLDTDSRRMTSEYTYELGFHRITTDNEVISDPMILDIIEGLNDSVWKGYVKNVSFKSDYYPALNEGDGYEPVVYYLLESSSSVLDSPNAEYKKTNANIMTAIDQFQQYGNKTEIDDTIPEAQITADLNTYSALKTEIEGQQNGWTKATLNSKGEWEINRDNVYAVAIIFTGSHQEADGYLQLWADLNMRAPALENDTNSTNNNRASYNEAHVFAKGMDNTGKNFPMYSVSNKTLVILRHSVELVKVSAKDSRRLTGAEFSVLNSTDPADYVRYYTFDKKRNKNEQHEMKEMPVDLGGSLILNLAPGIYYYQETKAPAGFKADPSLYQFRVVADSNAVYYYTADLKTSDELRDEYLVINYDEYYKYKDTVYSGKDNVLTSSVFHVYDGNKNQVGQFRWDSSSNSYVYDETELTSPISDLNCEADGTITISNLEAGTYFFGKSPNDADSYYFSVADNSSIKLKVIQKSTLSSGLVYNIYEKSGSDIAANDQLCCFIKNTDGSYSLSSSETNGAASGITPKSDGRVVITGLDPLKQYYFTIKESPSGFKKSNKSVLNIVNQSGIDLYAAEQLEYTGRIIVEDDPIEVASAKFKKIDATAGDNYGTLLNGAEYSMYLVESDGSDTKLYFEYNTETKQYLFSGTSGNSAFTDTLVSGVTNNGTGMIEVTGLPYGTYFLQETKAPIGYQLNSEKKYFRVSATTIDVNGNLIFSDDSSDSDSTESDENSGESQGSESEDESSSAETGTSSASNDTMTLSDYEVLSQIILTKNDYRDTSDYLKGAWYNIYRLQPNTDESVTAADYLTAAQAAATNAKGNTDNIDFQKYWGYNYVKQEQTDTTGSATFSNMPFGTYLVYEYRAPIGYTWNNDADKWTTWTTKNKTKIESQIIELSADTIYRNSDTRTLIGTDENGNDYAYEQTEYYAFYSNHLDDRQTGEARLLKSSTDSKPLTDGNFSLYQVNFTDNEKKAAVVKYCGKTENEANAMPSAQLDEALEKITLTDADFIQSEHFENNKPKANLDTVIKQGLATSDDPTIGATETVSGLDWGVYYFYEVKAPSGYQQDTTPKLFNVNSGSVGTTIEVNMTDDKTYGEIWLYKQEKDSAHKKLFGAQFDLFTEDNVKVKAVPRLRLGGLTKTADNGVDSKNRKEFLVTSVTVSSSTQIVFSILDDDNTAYTVTADYEMTVDGKITGVSVSESEFASKYGTGYNTTDTRGDLRLAYYAVTDDESQIYDDNTKKYRAITSSESARITTSYITADEGGRLNVRGLDWDSYYFRETVPPEGYGIAEDVIFTINAYNCDNQFLKCEDPAATATIIIDKEIPNTEYFNAYGEPTFMFKVYQLRETDGNDADYTRNTTKYEKTGKEYTLAIHMSDTTGSAMVNVPVGQYLIEEMPVSRYECYGIEVVGTAADNVKVKSAASDTKTSKFIFDNSKYELNSTTYKAFCDLTGAAASEEVLVFRVKYENRIKRYDSFSEVTFADNRIPGQEYVTAFKPIYTPLVTVNSGTADYTYQIDLAAALANGNFEGILTYNTGKTKKLTSADLTSNIAFNNTDSTPIKSVILDGTTLKVTVENPVSLAGQSISLDVGYAKEGLTEYDINNTSMVRGTLNLTFSEVQADSRKRLILKNDAGNSSWFGDDPTNGKTSISLAFIKSAADGSITSDPATITALSVENGYEFKYWYLLGTDGRPILDRNTGEVMQFADYTAIQNYIFNGTLPTGVAFNDADKYLENVAKINGFTFQAEVAAKSGPTAMLKYNNISGTVNSNGETNGSAGLSFRAAISSIITSNKLVAFKRETNLQIAQSLYDSSPNNRKLILSPVIGDANYDPAYPDTVYAYAVGDDTNGYTIYWFSKADRVYLEGDYSGMFYWSFQNYLNDVSGLYDFDFSGVTALVSAFSNNKYIEEIRFNSSFEKLKYFQGRYTGSMSAGTFNSCTSLKTVSNDMNSNLAQIVTTNNTFSNCSSLTDISTFFVGLNISNITNSWNTFGGAASSNISNEKIIKMIETWTCDENASFLSLAASNRNMNKNGFPAGTYDCNGGKLTIGNNLQINGYTPDE